MTLNEEFYILYRGVSGMIINTCNIDTIYGNRTINLIREDIKNTKADLIAFSANADTNEEVKGQVYESLKKVYNMDFKGRKKLSTDINDVKCRFWKEKHDSKWTSFLMARIPPFQKEQNMTAAYDKHVKAIFASIKALEFNDCYFQDISLPIIEGNKNIDYYESIKILLSYSIRFLKESKSTETINFYILKDEEELEWINAFEKTLGRNYYKQGSIVVIESLINNLKEIIDNIFDSGNYKELEYVLRLISRELEQVDSLSINNIAINSRKISEIVAKEIAGRKNLNIHKIKFDLSAILNVIASKDIIAPWVVQYLHTARVFGNRSAHVETATKFIPTRLYNSDFISILASLYNILVFWYYNKEKI